MNLTDQLDPQIAALLAIAPTEDQIALYVSGQAGPVLREFVEMHMRKSPLFRYRVEYLQKTAKNPDHFLKVDSGRGLDWMGRPDEGWAHLKLKRFSIQPHANTTASTVHLKNLPGLPSHIQGDAGASPEGPEWCSTLRLQQKGSADHPPCRLQVSWPNGKRKAEKWKWDAQQGCWQTCAVLPEPWSNMVPWLQDGQVHFAEL